MKRLISLLCLLAPIFLTTLTSCSGPDTTEKITDTNKKNQKTGVLLVSHGSHSETWRNTLFELENNVSQQILSTSPVDGIKSAFMEYTEPSIATRLKEFDKEGYSDVIIVPVLLTVSSHSFDDIPTIVGLKENPESAEMLKLEKIERYTPHARLHITPLLDFKEILQNNILRRVGELSKNPPEEGLAIIGYGSKPYEKEWSELFDAAAKHVASQTGIETYSVGWCGHIVSYAPDSTTAAVERVLAKEKKAIVIPALVAFDENFQIRIIGGGIEKVDNHKDRVLYKPDAILPDPGVEQWIVDISKEYAEIIKTQQK